MPSIFQFSDNDKLSFYYFKPTAIYLEDRNIINISSSTSSGQILI